MLVNAGEDRLHMQADSNRKAICFVFFSLAATLNLMDAFLVISIRKGPRQDDLPELSENATSRSQTRRVVVLPPLAQLLPVQYLISRPLPWASRLQDA